MSDRPSMLPENQDFDEIDLREIFLVLYRQRWTIIGITLIATLSAFFISFFMPKTYQVEAVVSLDRIDTSPIKPADAQAVLQGDGLLQQALTKLGMDKKPEEFKLQAQVIKDSNLVKVSLDGKNVQEVNSLIAEIVNSFLEKRNRLYQERLNTLKNELELIKQEIDQLTKTENAFQQVVNSLTTLPAEAVYNKLFALQFSQLMDPQKPNKNSLIGQRIALEDRITGLQKAELAVPLTPPKVVKPRVILNTAVAFVLGLMLGIFLAFLQNYIKTSSLLDKAA